MNITVLLEWGEVIWKYGSYIFIFWVGVTLVKFLLKYLKDKLTELDADVGNVAKTCDKISLSQEKIATNQEKNTQSQAKLVKLIESVDRKINGGKQ